MAANTQLGAANVSPGGEVQTFVATDTNEPRIHVSYLSEQQQAAVAKGELAGKLMVSKLIADDLPVADVLQEQPYGFVYGADHDTLLVPNTLVADGLERILPALNPDSLRYTHMAAAYTDPGLALVVPRARASVIER